jgi:lysophospholipase L1-like esterase
MKKNISLAITIVVLILIILEFGLRFIGFTGMKSKLVIDFDKRRANPPYRTSKTLGWDLLPNWEGEVSLTKVSTNSFGMRDDEFPFEKPENSLRILVLGDSFTFGLGVEQSAIYPKQLEQILNRQESEFSVSVLNGGVGGYNTEQELKWLKEKGLAFDPDIVIVGFVLNDVIYRGISNIELQPWPIQLLCRTAIYNVLSYAIKSLRLESDPLKRSIATTKKLTEESGEINELWEECFGYIEEMKDLTDEEDIPLLFVLFPWPNQLLADSGDPTPQVRLIRHLEKLGIDYIDLLPAYRNVNIDLFTERDNHPSARGHEIAALEIASYLNKSIFPGQPGLSHL